MGIPERGRRKKGTEEIPEIVTAENCPKLMTNAKPQIQEDQRAPSRITKKIGYFEIIWYIWNNMIQIIGKHIFKLQKNQKTKRKSWQSQSGGKKFTYRGTRIRTTLDFSSKTMQARRQWDKIFEALEEKKKTPAQKSISSHVLLQTWRRKKYEIWGNWLPELACKKCKRSSERRRMTQIRN